MSEQQTNNNDTIRAAGIALAREHIVTELVQAFQSTSLSPAPDDELGLFEDICDQLGGW